MVLPRTPRNIADSVTRACAVAQPFLGIGCHVGLLFDLSMPERALGAIEYALKSCLSGNRRPLMEGEDATVFLDGAGEGVNSVDDAS